MIVAHEKCFVCGNIADFNIADGATLLREATCNNCGASIRNSDTACAIVNVMLGRNASISECLNELEKFKILEASALGPIHSVLKLISGYVCFEYFDDTAPGQTKNGILCNDFEQLTFRDNSFDLIISQDVLEHVSKPYKAFSEIHRVLKMNGYHIFTVPLHEERPTLNRVGLSCVYHGDPLRHDGILVYTDWGDDICSLIDKHGMYTYRIDAHKFYEPREITNVDKSFSEYLSREHINYFRYNSVVFVSKKIKELEMKFTGERFIPNISLDKELEIEHLQRYHSIVKSVKGKVVVDAACGEGYGSDLLATYATKVYGIDISEEAINHAKRIYQKNNLEFITGSIESLPLANNAVDVVVSFETIEHVNEEIQGKFLEEISRILKKSGILIISTPDKYIYSDLPNFKNEYHIKEFYKDEFYSFLKKHFNNVELYYQRFQVASIISNDKSRSLDAILLNNDMNNSGKYLIAVCANKRTPLTINSVVLDCSLSNSYLQVFWEKDNLFTEENSVKTPLKYSNGFFEYDITLPFEIGNSLRLDPGNIPSYIEIKSIYIYNSDPNLCENVEPLVCWSADNNFSGLLPGSNLILLSGQESIKFISTNNDPQLFLDSTFLTRCEPPLFMRIMMNAEHFPENISTELKNIQIKLEDKNKELCKYMDKLSAMQLELSEKEEQLVSWGEEVTKLQLELSEKEEQLTIQTEDFKRLQLEFITIKVQLSQMVASRSWRITAPLRWIGQVIRRIIKNS